MTYLRILLLIASIGVVGCQANAEPPPAANLAPEATATPVATTTPGLTAEPTPPAVSHAPTDAAPTTAADSRAASADSPAEARVREITIPAGTRLSLLLGSTVSSRSSSVEDPVQATVRTPIVINGVTVVPAGTAVSGHVTEARRSGRVKGRARVGMRFNTLRVAGTRYAVRTASIAREAPGTKKEDAAKIGIGAGAGAITGAIAGGKKGAAIGTAVGGGAGTGVVLATRGREVSLPRGTVVTTRLTAPLTIRIADERN